MKKFFLLFVLLVLQVTAIWAEVNEAKDDDGRMYLGFAATGSYYNNSLTEIKDSPLEGYLFGGETLLGVGVTIDKTGYLALDLGLGANYGNLKFTPQAGEIYNASLLNIYTPLSFYAGLLNLGLFTTTQIMTNYITVNYQGQNGNQINNTQYTRWNIRNIYGIYTAIDLNKNSKLMLTCGMGFGDINISSNAIDTNSYSALTKNFNVFAYGYLQPTVELTLRYSYLFDS